MDAEAHARLTELFGEALELDEPEQRAVIARVRAGDPHLADELAALLEADREAEVAVHTGALSPTALERPGRPMPRARRGGGAAAAPAIAGYRIVGVLGEGGMGTIYAAEQDAPRRPVAIKVLHARSEAALARFWAEAEIMARLDHVGIAKILEAGEAEGRPYFVMERVDGTTLDVHVRGRPLGERLALFAAICDAVHHAHVKGVFHRDLKPSNVMVRADGRVAVLDFGIARVAAAGGSSDGETLAGELIGTPIYMSPEQARLRPDEVDARSDVYTLGVILYELAAGALPYDVRGKALPELTRAICDDPPRRLSRHGRALRGDLEAICDRALAKEPERRYPSAAMLADDVRRHLAGEAVSARAPGALEQVRRFARRRPAVALAAGGATTVLVVFAAVVTSLWLEASAARRLAEAERARVAIAHAALEERTHRLVLDQARALLASDPTRSLALLRTLGARGVDPAEAWAIADEAFGRGVARDVREAHTDEARWVEAAPGGYVSGGYDGRALRWTSGAAAPRELAQLPGRVHRVRPSPDGRWFAIAGDGGIARVVDEAGAVIGELGPLEGDVKQLAWSPDGARLAVGDEGGRVRVWSREAGARRLDGDAGRLASLAWSAGGAAVVAGGDDGAIWRWDVATGAAARGNAQAAIVAVWGAGERVAAAGADGRVTRWRAADGRLVAAGEVASGLACKTAAFAPDGRTAVLGGADGRVVRVGERALEPLEPHAVQVRSVVLDADGHRLATSSDDGAIHVTDLRSGRRLVLRGHAQRVRQLAFAAGGAELLSGGTDGEVRRWELDRVPPTVFEPRAEVARLAVSADGRVLVTADAGGELRRWELATGATTRVGVAADVVALAAGAGAVISAAADGTLVWWTARPEVRRAAPGKIRALAISADERWVAAATGAGPIALFAGDGAAVATLAGHAGGTEAIAFSPDGALLVSGGQDRVVRAWRTAAPSAPPVELGPLGDDTRHVVFARAGAAVLASGDDGTVRAWTVAAGAIDPASARVVAGHRGASVALAGDGGDRVLSVGRDRGRLEIDLGLGRVHAVAADAARSGEAGAGAPRGVPLPLPGGRELWVAADGRTIVVRDASPRDLDALRARLD